jgi:hypothetical protein
MDVTTAIDRIVAALDSADDETINTSMRIPVALRDAALVAVNELGVAVSTTMLTTAALRSTLEAIVMRAALDEHYESFPKARPSLAELAVAAAEIDGHPLAQEPARIHAAAAELVGRRVDPTPDDVLLWAEARAFSAA